MADLSITVSSTIDMVGGDPPNFWGAYNWNAFDWGSGGPVDDVIVSVGKLIANSQGETTTYRFDVVHLMEGDDFTIDTAVIVSFAKLIGSTISVSHDLSEQILRDGAGWKHIFPSNADDGEDRDFASWTAGTNPSDGWSQVSNPSDSWS